MITLFFIKLNAILDAVTCRCDLHNRRADPRACVTPRFASVFACGETAGPCPIAFSCKPIYNRRVHSARFCSYEIEHKG